MYIIRLENGMTIDINPELLGAARSKLDIVSEEWMDEEVETDDSIFSIDDILDIQTKRGSRPCFVSTPKAEVSFFFYG